MFDKLNPYFLYAPDDPPAGDPPVSEDPPAGDPPKKPDGGGEDKKEYTQAELDTMFADRAKRAGSKALTDLYADLGLKGAKELKALVADVKKKADDEKSDLEKAQSTASDWEAKHKTLEESQKRDRMRYAVESEARKQKVLAEAVGDVYALIKELIKEGAIEFDEAGKPEGKSVTKAVKDILATRKHMTQAHGGARTDNDADNGTGSAQAGGLTDAEIEKIASDSGVSAHYIKAGLDLQKKQGA